MDVVKGWESGTRILLVLDPRARGCLLEIDISLDGKDVLRIA